MKFSKKLSTKQFIISQLVILIIGLSFLFGLFYILNIQYKKSSNPFSNGPVTTPPKTLRLDLDHPDEDTLTYSSSILVSGKTSPLKEVLIFTDSQDSVITSKKDGSFSMVINLDEGENRITATVFDLNGDFRSAERIVYFSKERI